MQPPWKLQTASDIIRDGLGLELLDAAGTISAEVFRCDADHSVTLRVFDAGVPKVVIEELVAHARIHLGTFEDGKPLPSVFKTEGAVEPHVGPDYWLARARRDRST